MDSELYAASVQPLKKVMVDTLYAVPLALRDISLRSVGEAGVSRDETYASDPIPVLISSPMAATGGSTVGSFDIIPAQVALKTSFKDPIIPCFSLGTHQKPELLVGREDCLKIIDRYLLPPASDPETPSDDQSTSQSTSDPGSELRSYAICGLGGMGKTQLAVQYAHTRKDSFQAIFWLNADDTNILASNFANIAEVLGLTTDTSDLAASRDVAMDWLAQPLRKTAEPETPQNFVNWLIIFDNVDNIDVLSEFWPKLGRGSVLVTSRDPVTKHNLYTRNGMDLQALTSAQSEELMQRLTHARALDDAQKTALSLIADQVGGLPLAIELMSSVFRHLRLSYVEILRYIDEEGLQGLLANQATLGGPEEVRSLATVWALDSLSDKTKVLLQIICLLDPDDIPETLLINKAGNVKLEEYPKTLGEYYTARADLLASSLVHQSAEHARLSVHRLVQATVREKMDLDQVVAAYLAVTSLISSAWTFQTMEQHHSVARFASCEQVFPSLLRFKNGLQKLISQDEKFPVTLEMARLFNDAGWYMFERGLQEETKSFCELAILIGERLQDQFGEKAIESIRESHSFLGIALVETNEHDLSMLHKQKWLDMLLQRKSEDGAAIEDYELGYAYNEIGVAYGNAERLDDAATAFERSIEIFQGLDNYAETMLGWPEPNLGFIYWMQNRLDDAEKALVEVLDIHAAEWGVDDTQSFKTGKILYGLGNVLEAQGQFEESFLYHQRCFNQYKTVLGTNHHRVGDICHKMAGHCMRLQLYKDAEVYLDSALKIFNSRAYLANEQARTTFKKGNLFRAMGRVAEADELLWNAYSIRRRLRPQDQRKLEALAEGDFDELVAFWSR